MIHYYSPSFTMWFKFLRHVTAKFPSPNFSWFQCLLILFMVSIAIFTLNRENINHMVRLLNIKLSMFLEPWIILKYVLFKDFFQILTFYSLCIFNIYHLLILSYMLDVLHILFLIFITNHRSRFSKFHFTIDTTNLEGIRNLSNLQIMIVLNSNLNLFDSKIKLEFVDSLTSCCRYSLYHLFWQDRIWRVQGKAPVP